MSGQNFSLMSRSIVKICSTFFSFSLLLPRLYLHILWSMRTEREMRREQRLGLSKCLRLCSSNPTLAEVKALLHGAENFFVFAITTFVSTVSPLLVSFTSPYLLVLFSLSISEMLFIQPFKVLQMIVSTVSRRRSIAYNFIIKFVFQINLPYSQ